jgi:hypothetical protein
MIRDDETYLGDGLYASFDGYQIKLRAPRGYIDDEVFLDAQTLAAFRSWAATLQGSINATTQEARGDQISDYRHTDAACR